MNIKFQAPKGHRLKKQFSCVELEGDDWLSYSYYPESREWRKDSGFNEGESYASTSCSCRSLKAAIRKIKKWNFPKGTTFRLCNIWIGYDVYITV